MKRLFISMAAFVMVFVFCMTAAGAFTTLKVGSKGSNVKKVQTVLKNHNFSVKVDGSYGSRTAYYVKKYQKMHHLKVDGKVGSNTWKSMLNKINIDKERLIQPKGKLPLKKGDKGEDVKFVQKILKAHRYPVKVDGKYGSKTVKYVKLYQKAHYLHVDGKVGEDTWESMSYSYKILPYIFPKATIKKTPSRFPITANSSKADIRKVEQALVALKLEGTTLTAADDVYDANTVDAILRYHRKITNDPANTDNTFDRVDWEALIATETDKKNIDLLAKIIDCESGGAHWYEHIAIANVVIDFAAKKKRSIEKELKSGRYDPCDNWKKFLKTKPSKRCYENAKKAYYDNVSVFGDGKAYYFHVKSYVPEPGTWWRKQYRFGLVDKHVFYGEK